MHCLAHLEKRPLAEEAVSQLDLHHKCTVRSILVHQTLALSASATDTVLITTADEYGCGAGSSVRPAC
jgi:hypothetical protein